MDGVLADFELAVEHLSQGRTDLNNQGKLMTDEAKNAKKQRWQRIEVTAGFFENLHIVPKVQDLVSTAKDMGEIFVLTAVPSAKNFIAGESFVEHIKTAKRQWIADKMTDFFHPESVLIVTGAKENQIKPSKTDILIDDRAGNVADWIAAGGTGIHFKSAEQSIKDLTSFRLLYKIPIDIC
jgi:5'(3')-deoxyribonucleotidase